MTMRVLSCFAALVLFLVPACGPGNGGDGNGEGDASVPLDDADGDTIVDVHEGVAELVDTDGDGTPDYLDLDSDGDGIADNIEAGDDALDTPPVDSDTDGVPDFRDGDSDGNGVHDAVEGASDLDGDGTRNYADIDNDGDGISDIIEIGANPSAPRDTNGNMVPDYMDLDSDSDFILDEHEREVDPDNDGKGSYIDDDSDGDCIPDIAEAGDAILATPPRDTDMDGRPDFHDRDSDADGLTDTSEDQNCNGVRDVGETSAIDDDTDGDGVTDLVEVTAGTDPNNPNDNPRSRGDFVFLVPYEEPTSPADDDLDFSTSLRVLDAFVLVDRSGSMTDEIAAIRNNIQTVANNVTCPPIGNGNPVDCIPDVWWGSGTIGYNGTGGQPFQIHSFMQPNASSISNLPINSPPGPPYTEVTMLGLWSTCTGQGSATSGCPVGDPWAPLSSCASMPAGASGIGYPCFRPNALPIILLATDEAPITGADTYHCPAQPNVCNAANAVSAKIVGIKGAGGGVGLDNDLASLATCTGAVDANNGNEPLVVAGADSGSAAAIESAIRTLARGVPLDISAQPSDDLGDSVDAVGAFIQRLETLQLGTPECTAGLVDQDSNSDGFDDLYLNVLPGTPVCWRLVPKMNTTITPTQEPQLYRARIDVVGDGVTELDSRDVYFLVPPEIVEPVIE